MKKTKFHWREWHWTQVDENLFALDRFALAVYRDLLKLV